MKRVSATMAVLLLSSGLALAQGGGGAAGGGTGVGGTGGLTGSGTMSPTNPNAAPVPPTNGTVGQAPGTNPSNSQDLSNRNNPQDMTKPGAGNPQDLKR
jgi:hypothetical protein